MSADVLGFAVAVILPIATLAALAGLIAHVGELERSRDELVELRASRR